MRCDRMQMRAALVVLAFLLGWIGVEASMTTVPLASSEAEKVVGGISFCADANIAIGGYRCGNARSMACDNVCDQCAEYSNNASACALHKCWGCESGGVHSQIRECIISMIESDICNTFGGAEACGNRQERPCALTVGTCYCNQPLFPTEAPCPRKDCS